MVKATEMAKPFEQQPIHWFRNTQIQEIIAAYTKLRNCSLADFSGDIHEILRIKLYELECK